MDTPIQEDKITLCNPNGVQGGSYMTKVKYEDSFGFYFQTPKLDTKQGIIMTDKKNYFDLMIDSSNSDILTWVENLEECLQKKIYEKRNMWFETELDMEDIQNTMTPLLRPFRGGKYNLLRVAIPTVKNLVGQTRCAIYDENENMISAKDISNEDKIICILEIQCIKFSSKYFQVDINAKQIMVFKNLPIFKSCLIKTVPTSRNDKEDFIADSSIKNTIGEPKIIEHDEPTLNESDVLDSDALKPMVATESAALESVALESAALESAALESAAFEPAAFEPAAFEPAAFEPTIDTEPSTSESSVLELNENIDTKNQVVSFDENRSTTPIINSDENLDEMFNTLPINNVPKSSNTLEEINIELENNGDDILQLKTKEFYYDIYRTALDKAKKAKRQALECFLEAKKIKETYMLDEIDNNTSDEEDLENSDDSDLEEDYEILS